MSAPSPRPLVVTGASGFVGRRVVALAAAALGDRPVTLVVRDPARWEPPVSLPPAWRVIGADLAAESGTPHALVPADLPEGATVLHLAAATGRLSPAQMLAFNVGATRRLLEAAGQRRAGRFVYVSSIAAAFADQRWYPYAHAKRDAEALVRSSGVPYTIVRPTMVFGPGSPVQAGLARLAEGPPVSLGTGTVQVQPIHVDDLAQALLALCSDLPPSGTLLELGGADRCTVRDLLACLRAARALPARRTLPLPLGLLRRSLALAESALPGRLPITAGQLASFVNDSIAAPHPLAVRYLPQPRGLDAVLAPDDRDALDRANRAQLQQEFATLARYLGTTAPSARALAAYARARAGDPQSGDRVDEMLLAVARRGPRACALADAYARVARPFGTLRRRLVLTLAILESGADSHAPYDTAHAAGAAATWAALVLAGAAWAARTLLAVLCLAPLHLAVRQRRASAPGTPRAADG